MLDLLAQQQEVDWQTSARNAGQAAVDLGQSGWDLVQGFTDTETGGIIVGVIVLWLLFRGVRRRVG